MLYTGRASSDLPSEEVFRIIETSTRNNPSRGVAGFPISNQGRFLQLVEGEMRALDELLDVLLRDPRHSDLTVFYGEAASQRCLPNWRIRQLGSSAEAGERILRMVSQHDIGAQCMPLSGEFLTYAEFGCLKRTA